MNTQDRNVGMFFVLAFAFTWLLYLPSLLVRAGVIPAPFDMKIYAGVSLILGAFGPLFAAIVLLVKASGWSAVWQLIRKAFDFRFKPIYLLRAFLLPLIVTAGSHYFIKFTGMDSLPNSLGLDNLPYPIILWAIPAFFSMLFIGGGQEEFGWRGYAQEPLQERFGVLKGSLSFKEMKDSEYESWLDSWLSKLKFLLKENASIYICGDWKTSAPIFRVGSKYFQVQNRITWEREKGRGAKANWKNCSEDIWFFTNSNNYTFNVDAVKLGVKF